MTRAVRQAVWSVNRDQAIARVMTMDALVAASSAQRRFTLLLFEVFGFAALLLAAAGIYGVLAGTVAERMREIGVRAALGATRNELVALVIGQGARLVALGMVIGVVGAMSATRLLRALLYGVSPLDPWSYAGGIVLLAAVGLAASGVPAWRAARVDPASTLRVT